MLVTNETPQLTWTVADTDGGTTWQPGAPVGQLTNGQPRVGVRFYRTSGSAGLRLSAVWSTASRPSVFVMLGLGQEWLLKNFNVLLRTASTGDFDISYDASGVELPDGSVAAVLLIPSSIPLVDGIRIEAFGSDSEYTIGEIVAATSTEWCIRRDWTETVVALSKELRSVTGQPTAVRRVQQRKAVVTIAPQQWTKSFSASATVTLQKLQARLSQYQPVLVIPALRQPGLGAGALIDMDTVLATMLFGTCSNLGQISLVSESNLSQLRLEFTEAPAGRIA